MVRPVTAAVHDRPASVPQIAELSLQTSEFQGEMRFFRRIAEASSQ